MESGSSGGTPGPLVSYLKPLMISMLGVVLTVTAILVYHLILVRFCKRRRDAAPGVLVAGVDKKVLEGIPVSKFSAVRRGFGFEQDAECVVCLGQVGDEEMVRLLPNCHHAFHVTCVDQWLAEHVTCPLCRSPITEGKPLPTPIQSSGDAEIGEPRETEEAESPPQTVGLFGRCASLMAILPTERSQPAPPRIKRSMSMDHSVFVDLEECGDFPPSPRATLRRSGSVALSLSRHVDHRPSKWQPNFWRWRVVRGRSGRILPY